MDDLSYLYQTILWDSRLAKDGTLHDGLSQKKRFNGDVSIVVKQRLNWSRVRIPYTPLWVLAQLVRAFDYNAVIGSIPVHHPKFKFQ